MSFALGAYFAFDPFHTKPPLPNVTIEEMKVEVIQGSYCWEGVFKKECVDTFSPPELVKHQHVKAFVTSSESEIKIQFKNEPLENSLGVNVWRDSGIVERVLINEHSFTAPKSKGVYIYEVFARWDKGNSSYVFMIEVP